MLSINNPKLIDPALLTLHEYMNLVDPSHKTHPDDAYNWSIMDKNNEWDQKSNYPKFLRRLKLAGLEIEIRVRVEPCRYIKLDDSGMPLRINGEIQFWTSEEAKRLGKKLEEYLIGVFHGNQKIGEIQDEWGCVLVSVAKEYQNIGLGTILQKLARTLEPTKPSGGFTPAGRAGFARVHREFVRDALKNGTYSSLVRSKKMTMERVKEIVASAHIEKRNKPNNRNLSSSDPKDWLLFVGEYGDFILYDKKLKDLIEEGGEQNDYFIDSMIKGAVNVRELNIPRQAGICLLTLFGGDTDKIKQFMMKLALSFAETEGFRLYVDQSDIKYITNGSAIGDINLKTRYKRQEFKLDGEPIMYNLLGAIEKQFRKKFDRYGEFKDRLMELAYTKYRII